MESDLRIFRDFTRHVNSRLNMVNVEIDRQSYNHHKHMTIRILLAVIRINQFKMVTILRLSIVDVNM
jgi:hypothetical protein